MPMKSCSIPTVCHAPALCSFHSLFARKWISSGAMRPQRQSTRANMQPAHSHKQFDCLTFMPRCCEHEAQRAGRNAIVGGGCNTARWDQKLCVRNSRMAIHISKGRERDNRSGEATRSLPGLCLTQIRLPKRLLGSGEILCDMAPRLIDHSHALCAKNASGAARFKMEVVKDEQNNVYQLLSRWRWRKIDSTALVTVRYHDSGMEHRVTTRPQVVM